MTPRIVNQLRESLREKKAELLSELQKARERLKPGFVGDRMDQAQIFADDDLEARHVDFNWTLLGQVQSALQAMEESTYGRCLTCDNEIPVKRLLANPWALYCVGCQEAIEQGSGIGPYQPGQVPGAHQHYALAS